MNLDQLADIQMGYPFRSRLQHDPAGDIAVIQMKDLDDASLLHADTAIRVSLPGGKDHHLLRPGDLLLRSRGQSYGTAIVGPALGAAVLAAPMLMLRPRRVLPAYLHWFLNTPSTQATLATLAAGTAVRVINAEALRSLEVPLPPLAEQQRIVDVAVLAQREQELADRIARRRRDLTNHILMNYAHKATP